MTVKLHSTALLYFILRHSFKLVVLGLFVVLFVAGGTMHSAGHASALQTPRMILVAFYLLLLLAVVGYHWMLVKSYNIELTKDGVALHYGVFNLSREVLLYNKVQDIVITRSIFERVLGLSTLIIQNAAGKPEYVPGLSNKDAEKLRGSILANAKA
jgi:membrane protein YdbS with pleckstrin-like domain